MSRRDQKTIRKRAAIERRSAIMRSIKSTNTKPELTIRSLVHSLGFRFRLHRSDLPGRPDIALPRLHRVIFVNGCFWHGHRCARGARVPKSNRSYWIAKICRNKERDRQSLANLKKLGWQSLVIWECQIKDRDKLVARILKFLTLSYPPSARQ